MPLHRFVPTSLPAEGLISQMRLNSSWQRRRIYRDESASQTNITSDLPLLLHYHLAVIQLQNIDDRGLCWPWRPQKLAAGQASKQDSSARETQQYLRVQHVCQPCHHCMSWCFRSENSQWPQQANPNEFHREITPVPLVLPPTILAVLAPNWMALFFSVAACFIPSFQASNRRISFAGSNKGSSLDFFPTQKTLVLYFQSHTSPTLEGLASMLPSSRLDKDTGLPSPSER